jgi:hypothetical protein
MSFKKRTYIGFSTTITTGSQINLQTAYNASKTGDEKLSDDTVSGAATFGSITFHHDKEIKVILDSGDIVDEIIFPLHKSNEVEEHTIPGGKNIIFKNDSGNTVALKVFATVINQPNTIPDASLPYPIN